MITYILKANRFLSFEKELVNNDDAIGKTFADYEAGRLVKLTAAQVAFHEAHPGATAKEVFEKKLAPPPEPPARTLAQAIAEKLSAIETYDRDVVNQFVIRFGEVEVPCWFDAQQRSTYKTSIDAAIEVDDETIEIGIAGQFVELPVAGARNMLARVQRYADKSFNRTERHRAAVAGMTDIAEVDGYDYTADYPEVLIFNL